METCTPVPATCFFQSGVPLDTLDDKFWRRAGRRVQQSGNDVILRRPIVTPSSVGAQTCCRTKRFMSDQHWQRKVILFMPAAIAASMAGTAPPGPTHA